MTAADTAPPPLHPLANVLGHGFRTAVHRDPGNAETDFTRQHHGFRSPRPRNPLQVWLSDDVARMQMRGERVARIERRERDRSGLRVEFSRHCLPEAQSRTPPKTEAATDPEPIVRETIKSAPASVTPARTDRPNSRKLRARQRTQPCRNDRLDR